MDQPKSVALSCTIYRRLLHLRPGASFLRDYESLMLSDHHQQCLSAYRKRGSFGVFLLWPMLFTYTIRDLGNEHLVAIQKYMTSKSRPSHPMMRSSWIAIFAYCRKSLAWLGGALIAGLFTNIGSSWFDSGDPAKTPLNWLVDHPLISLPLLFLLMACTLLARLALAWLQKQAQQY